MTNIASNTVTQYAADGAGALSELAPAVAAPRSPFGLALAPDGKSLYVAGFGDATIGQYDVAADGSLAVKADPAPANFRPQAVVAVKPRDEQAPTIDLVTPADGAQYEQDAAVAVDYTCADEGPLRPSVVHGRRARRRPAGHLDARFASLHGGGPRRGGQRDDRDAQLHGDRAAAPAAAG